MNNRKIINRIEGEVLDTRMVMTVRLPEGTVVKVNGNAPKGSTLDLWATDVTRNGQLLGYEGYEVLSSPKKEAKSVHQTPWFKVFEKGLSMVETANAVPTPIYEDDEVTYGYLA